MKAVRLAEVLAPGLVPRVAQESVAEMVLAPAAASGPGLVLRVALAPAAVWASEPDEVPILEQAPEVGPGLVAETGLALAASWVRGLAEVLVLEQAPGVALAPAVLAILGRCS